MSKLVDSKGGTETGIRSCSLVAKEMSVRECAVALLGDRIIVANVGVKQRELIGQVIHCNTTVVNLMLFFVPYCRHLFIIK